MAFNFLIVDDSAIVRKVVVKTLGLTNLEVGVVLQAENGRQALDLLNDHWVDLVFLDINMPIMDGMQFMDELRANEDLKDTKVVVVSTEGSRERREKLESMKICSYLRKPVTPESLSEAVHHALGVEGK